MGSAFHDRMAVTGLPMLLSVHGEAVTYVPVTGSAVSLTAIVGDVTTLDDDDEEGRTARASCDVTIGLDPAASTGGVADPSLKDKVTIGSDVWAVESIEALGGAFCRLRVVRDESIEKTREGYRGRR